MQKQRGLLGPSGLFFGKGTLKDPIEGINSQAKPRENQPTEPDPADRPPAPSSACSRQVLSTAPLELLQPGGQKRPEVFFRFLGVRLVFVLGLGCSLWVARTDGAHRFHHPVILTRSGDSRF